MIIGICHLVLIQIFNELWGALKSMLEKEVLQITGESSGTGFATAELCLKKGATVIITGRNKNNLDKANKNLLKISSKVVKHNIDVSLESEITD